MAVNTVFIEDGLQKTIGVIIRRLPNIAGFEITQSLSRMGFTVVFFAQSKRYLYDVPPDKLALSSRKENFMPILRDIADFAVALDISFEPIIWG